MICYNWKVGCLEAFQNVKEKSTQTITRIWIEIVHNLRGSLDNMNNNTQQAKLYMIGVSCHMGQRNIL